MQGVHYRPGHPDLCILFGAPKPVPPASIHLPALFMQDGPRTASTALKTAVQPL